MILISQTTRDLWSLVLTRQYIDAGELARAIEAEVSHSELDFRTRLLIRDSVDALERHWGPSRSAQWLAGCPQRSQIEAVKREELGEPGFGSLVERVIDATQPETVEQLLRELGLELTRPVRVAVGGSISLILTGYLSRHTEDLDVVDEVPAEIRSLGRRVEALTRRYGLRFAHFQSHYLPAGWQSRLHFYATFGQLQVSLVDVYDVFLSKLFSSREKDRDDLRALVPQLDRGLLSDRLRAQASWLAEKKLRPRAEKNWYVLFGEPLPT